MNWIHFRKGVSVVVSSALGRPSIHYRKVWLHIAASCNWRHPYLRTCYWHRGDRRSRSKGECSSSFGKGSWGSNTRDRLLRVQKTDAAFVWSTQKHASPPGCCQERTSNNSPRAWSRSCVWRTTLNASLLVTFAKLNIGQFIRDVKTRVLLHEHRSRNPRVIR